VTSSRRSGLRLVLGVAALVAVVAGLFLALSRNVQRAVEVRAMDAIVAAAKSRMEASEGGSRAADFINIPIVARELAPGIHQATGVGNVHVIVTDEGDVVFDTGLSLQAAKQRAVLEAAIPDLGVDRVILSHSHADHASGTRVWADEGVEVIAHVEFPEEQRYLKQLEPYLHGRNRVLFPFIPEEPPDFGPLAYGGVEPTRLVSDGQPYVFEQGGVRFEVIGAPGAEGADNLVLWLPEQKILLSGDFFGPLFPQFPNVFTMRGEKVRKPIEYVRSLELVIALEPEMIVPSHKDPIEGRERIRADLVRMRDAVQYVHDETVAGMNAGKTVHELMAEITLPPELELSQAHGKVSWAVRSIWEYYATWFHFDDTTELYPVPERAVWGDVVDAAGVDALVAKAQAHVERSEPVHALHLLKMVVDSGHANVAALDAQQRALEMLLEAAEAGAQNSYETDWLKAQLRRTDAMRAWL